MDDHIRKLDTKIQSRESELNALLTKIQKLEEEIATLYHKKLLSKKLESAEMTLTGVLGAIFETEEEVGVKLSHLSGQQRDSRGWSMTSTQIIAPVKRRVNKIAQSLAWTFRPLNKMTQGGNKLRQLC